MRPVPRSEFLDFALRHKALRLGSFTLRSGRSSPYFFDTGALDTGPALSRLGEFYAAAAMVSGIEFDLLFGPAYKGIPLAAATAVALYARHRKEVAFCCDRKEDKDHGEGGKRLGASPRGRRALILDDVLSTGGSARRAASFLHREGAAVAGLLVALDRMETAAGGGSCAEGLRREMGIRIVSIATLEDLLEYLRERPEGEYRQVLRNILEHRGGQGAAGVKNTDASW